MTEVVTMKRLYNDIADKTMFVGSAACIPIYVSRITLNPSKTARGMPYYKIECTSVAKNDVNVPFDKSVKKQKNTDIDIVEGSIDGNTDLSKCMLRNCERFYFTGFGQMFSSVKSGDIVTIQLTADIYNGKFTFKSDKIFEERLSKTQLIKKYVSGSDMTRVPVLSDFDLESNDEYSKKDFILPLSAGTSTYDVHIELDVTDKYRFHSKRKDDVKEYVGINSPVSQDKTSNIMHVIYTPKNKQEKKIWMRFAYFQEVWRVFGISDVNAWRVAGPVLLQNARDCFVSGTSTLGQLQSIRGNKINDDDCEDFEYSTGFVVSIDINLEDTIRASFTKLDYDAIVHHFGIDSGYSYDNENTDNILNVRGWKEKIKSQADFCFNLTEFDEMQLASFLKEADVKKFEYYGLFENNNTTGRPCVVFVIRNSKLH